MDVHIHVHVHVTSGIHVHVHVQVQRDFNQSNAYSEAKGAELAKLVAIDGQSHTKSISCTCANHMDPGSALCVHVLLVYTHTVNSVIHTPSPVIPNC